MFSPVSTRPVAFAGNARSWTRNALSAATLAAAAMTAQASTETRSPQQAAAAQPAASRTSAEDPTLIKDPSVLLLGSGGFALLGLLAALYSRKTSRQNTDKRPRA